MLWLLLSNLVCLSACVHACRVSCAVVLTHERGPVREAAPPQYCFDYCSISLCGGEAECLPACRAVFAGADSHHKSLALVGEAAPPPGVPLLWLLLSHLVGL
jgi:hypothetical protein